MPRSGRKWRFASSKRRRRPNAARLHALLAERSVLVVELAVGQAQPRWALVLQRARARGCLRMVGTRVFARFADKLSEREPDEKTKASVDLAKLHDFLRGRSQANKAGDKIAGVGLLRSWIECARLLGGDANAKAEEYLLAQLGSGRSRPELFALLSRFATSSRVKQAGLGRQPESARQRRARSCADLPRIARLRPRD